MELVHFMTNTCGWGLKLIDGCTLGSDLGLETDRVRDGLRWRNIEISPGKHVVRRMGCVWTVDEIKRFEYIGDRMGYRINTMLFLGYV